MSAEKAKCLALAEPHVSLCKRAHMSSVDDNLIIPEKGLFLIKNRTSEPFEVKKGRSYAKISLVRPGSKLVKMDAEIQKDYKDLDIDGLIKSEAPTGLQFGSFHNFWTCICQSTTCYNLSLLEESKNPEGFEIVTYVNASTLLTTFLIRFWNK